MSTDALGYTLALITLGMSMVAARNRNMLMTIGAAALWASLLGFITANSAAGENWLAIFIISAGTFIISFALLSFISQKGSFARKFIGSEYNENVEANPTRKRGLMSLSTDEYRRYVRSTLRRRK